MIRVLLLLIGLFSLVASACTLSSVLAEDSTDRISAKEQYELDSPFPTLPFNNGGLP